MLLPLSVPRVYTPCSCDSNTPYTKLLLTWVLWAILKLLVCAVNAPVTSNDPVTLELPLTVNVAVGDVVPIPTRLDDALTIRVLVLTVKLSRMTVDPEMVWFPTKVLDPVVAKTVEFSPSNKSALLA